NFTELRSRQYSPRHVLVAMLLQKGVDFAARWNAGATASACAFQRRDGTGKAHRFRNAHSFSQSERVGTVKDVAGTGGVDDFDGKSHLEMNAGFVDPDCA